MRKSMSISKVIQLMLLLLALTARGMLHSQTGDYYRMIHVAESKVVIEEYNEAIPLYQEAFNSNPSPFLKDLHNALLCSIKENDTISAKLFIDKIVKFDIDTAFYNRSEKGKELRDSENLYAYYKNQLSTKEPYFNLDCSFYKKMLALDQSIRTSCKELNSNYYAICGDEIKLLDSAILTKLENYFLTYGIPGEIDLCHVNPSNFPDYFLVVKHNMQWGRNPLDSILSNAVKNYKTHPQLYIDLADYYNESYLKQSALYGLGYTIKLGDRLFVFDVPTTLKQAIDDNRKSVFLDPIDEYNKKVIFQYRHPEFLLIYPSLSFTLNADPDMEKELALKWKENEVFKN